MSESVSGSGLGSEKEDYVGPHDGEKAVALCRDTAYGFHCDSVNYESQCIEL